MSEKTESALDRFIKDHHPLCRKNQKGCWMSECSCGRDQAAAELAELKAENEKSDVVLVFMQHELDIGRLIFRDAVEAIDKYRAELDEARKVIEMIDGLHPDFPVITAFLQAHPERK